LHGIDAGQHRVYSKENFMWTEIVDHKGTWTILGVIIGFSLAELTAIIKKRVERNDCKNALLDEVRFNQEQTKNKISILDQAIKTFKQKKFLSTQCAKYSTIEFDNLYHIAIPVLRPLEKDNFRHLNSFYKKIDSILGAFDQEFKSDIDNCKTRQNTTDSIYDSAVAKLKDIRDSLALNLDLTGGLLSGCPKPIFKSGDQA